MRTKKLLAGACASLMIAASAITTVTAAESVNVTIGNATAGARRNVYGKDGAVRYTVCRN